MAKTEMAIIGLGFTAGEFDSIESFMKGLMTSKKAFQPADTGMYPADRDETIEKAVSEALRDAALSPAGTGETAFILHTASSPEERQFAAGGEAARTAARFGSGGPAYTVYDGENSLFRGLSLAQHLFEEALASSVVICVAPPVPVAGADTFKASGKIEGAAVLILKEKNRALADRDKIYTCISAVAVAESEADALPPSGERETIAEGIASILEAGDIGHRELRVLEVPGSERSVYDQTIEQILREQFSSYLDDDAFAITDTESWLGRRLAITTAASFVKHALQLFFFHVFVFDPASASGPSLFTEQDPSIWNKPGEKRAAFVACGPAGGGTGEYSGFAVLTECIGTMADDRKCRSDLALLPLAFNSPDELQSGLAGLQNSLRSPDTSGKTGIQSGDGGGDAGLRAVWDDAWLAYRTNGTAAFTAALLFDSRLSLEEEISVLSTELEDLCEDGRFRAGALYESRRGSFFTVDPYGKDAKVVYMNPPGSMQHMLLFYEMLLLFPYFRQDYVNYQNSQFLHDMDQLDYRFGRFAVEMNMINIADKISSNMFGLDPDMIIGASLGEIAALFAYDSVDYSADPETGEAVLNLLRAFRDVYTYTPEQVRVKFVTGPLADIQKVTDREPEVRIGLYASSNGAFVNGTPEELERVVTENGWLSWVLSDSLAIHTRFVDHFYKPVYEAALKCKGSFKPDLNYEIYSAYYLKPVGDTIEDLSEFAAAILTKPCDFHGLLELLYAKGARVFVDMSTGGSCLTWAKDTFADRNTLCLSIYPSFIDSRGSLMRLFAKLLANHLDFNADAFLSAFVYPFMGEGDAGRESALEHSNSLNVRISAIPALDPQTLSAPAFPELMKDSGSGLRSVPPHEDSPDVRIADAMPFAASQLAPQPLLTATPPAERFAVLPYSADSSARARPKSLPAPVNRGIRSNMRAYSLYLENERLLLGMLRKRGFGAAAKKRPVWDYEQILEITDGAPSKVWGKRYASLDSVVKRARIPLPPFMFVSRIMEINAEFGKFQPSYVEIEYDIKDDCIMLMSQNTISYLLLTESSHVAVFLLAYIGIDLIYDGEICYRILNTTETFHSDFPVLGDTINARLEFLEFTKSGSTTLVKSRFTCYNRGELVMNMDLLGGFFTEDDLADTKGILPLKRLSAKPSENENVPKPAKESLAGRITDLQAFYNGDYGPLLYPARTSKQAERPYVHEKIRMLDRIISMDFTGGDYGLGKVVAEKEIDANHWAFGAHFKNDPVFPASLLAEAANQIQLLFAMNAGYTGSGKYLLGCQRDLVINSVFRGQITPIKSVLRFEQHIKAITINDREIGLVSDSDVYWQGKHVSRTENISLLIEEIIR